MSLLQTPLGAWRDLNKRYFAGELPTPRFQWVEPGGVLPELDTRCDWASVTHTDAGWLISLHSELRDSPRLLYFFLGHEAIHIKLPKAKHRDKAWNAETRRLQALGFFMKVFS